MLSKEDVSKTASLARIFLQDEEKEHLASDLHNIIGYVEKISELPLDDIEPTSHVLPLSNVTRADKAGSTLSSSAIKDYAIEYQDGYFKVPKVIES